MRKLYPFLTLGLLLTLPAGTAAAQVTFRVDMRYQSLAPGDEVVVRGSAASLGSWQGADHPLRSGVDPLVYETTLLVPELASGEVLYKYVIVRAGGEEVWEERGNRVLTPTTDALTLAPVFFSDVEEPGIAAPVSVRFLMDLGEFRFDDEPPTGIGVVGGRQPLSWEPADAIALQTTRVEGQWQVDVTFPAGTLRDVPFKLVYDVGGYSQWERTPGHINHLFLLPEDSSELVVHLLRDATLMRLVPDPASAGLLDQYGEIITTLGERGRKSEYGYYLATDLLERGETEAADRAYGAFTAAHPGEVETDDYHYERAKHLSAAGDVDGAVGYLREKRRAETTAERAAFLRYAEGEVLLNSGRVAEARRSLRELLVAEDPSTTSAGYARDALVLSYTDSGDPDTARIAVSMLEGWLGLGTEVGPSRGLTGLSREQKIRLWHALAAAYEAAGDVPGAIAAYDQVARSDTGRRRVRAADRAIVLRLRSEDEAYALELIDKRLPSANSEAEEARLLLLKARALEAVGSESDARTILEDVASRFPSTPHAEEAEGRLRARSRL